MTCKLLRSVVRKRLSHKHHTKMCGIEIRKPEVDKQCRILFAGNVPVRARELIPPPLSKMPDYSPTVPSETDTKIQGGFRKCRLL